MRRRITKIKRTNRIKKEHFYILGLILLLSIFGFLIYKVLIYKTKNNNPDTLIEANETIVDYKVPNTTICDGNTLDSIKQESYKINVEYSEIDKEIEANFVTFDDNDNEITSKGSYSIKVFVANIVNVDNDKFNVYVNNVTTGEKDIGIKLDNGNIQVIPDIDSEIEKYEVYVYDKSDCSGVLVRKFSFLTPIYNPNRHSLYCDDNPDLVECNLYIYDSSIDFTSEQFLEKINNYAEEKLSKEENNKKIDYKYIIGGSVIIIVIVIGVIVFIRRKK